MTLYEQGHILHSGFASPTGDQASSKPNPTPVQKWNHSHRVCLLSLPLKPAGTEEPSAACCQGFLTIHQWIVSNIHHFVENNKWITSMVSNKCYGTDYKPVLSPYLVHEVFIKKIFPSLSLPISCSHSSWGWYTSSKLTKFTFKDKTSVHSCWREQDVLDCGFLHLHQSVRWNFRSTLDLMQHYWLMIKFTYLLY